MPLHVKHPHRGDIWEIQTPEGSRRCLVLGDHPHAFSSETDLRVTACFPPSKKPKKLGLARFSEAEGARLLHAGTPEPAAVERPERVQMRRARLVLPRGMGRDEYADVARRVASLRALGLGESEIAGRVCVAVEVVRDMARKGAA